MTDRYKGFLVTLDKEIREDDSENIINALQMIKGVFQVKPYINGAEDWMMYEKAVWDTRKKMMEHMNSKVTKPI